MPPFLRTARDCLIAVLASAAITVLMLPLQPRVELSNTSILYVLLIVVVGTKLGRAPAIAAALAGSLLYAHVFVPPYFSLAITEIEYVVAAVVMLVVALLVGHLTSSLRSKAESLRVRETQARALYDFARRLTASQTSAEIEAVTRDFLRAAVGADDARIIAGDETDSFPLSAPPSVFESSTGDARAVIASDDNGGRAQAWIPLIASSGVIGILGCDIGRRREACDSVKAFLETCGSVVAVALERTRLAEAVRRTEVLRSAESLRNSILSALSHDLRTPLTVLVGMAETLADGKASPERQRRMLEAIRNQAFSINRQVMNLLDMARLKAGQIELNEAWQPVEEVIGATLQLVRMHWKDREISVDIQRDLPPLRFDAVLIERLLWNLLENALKYSPPDTPVEIGARRFGSWVELSVSDAGPGIPKCGDEEIFGMFSRGNPESTTPGVGLGLAIVKGIAEAHGGSVSAENRLGGGACFRFRLPMGNPPADIRIEETA
jgi:two-component system sensor histidine kinase KdpD